MFLIESVPKGLEKLIAATIPDGESYVIKLKGAFKECLVCTPKRLIIAKQGWLTGNLLGGNVFQIPMSAVSSVEVKYGLLTGYLEVSTGGFQSTDKSYWSQKQGRSASQAPNCIAISSRADADKFRRACSEVLTLADTARRS